MGEIGADIAVESWLFEFQLCSRFSFLPYVLVPQHNFVFSIHLAHNHKSPLSFPIYCRHLLGRCGVTIV